MKAQWLAAVAIVLVVAPNRSFALREIGLITKEQAKEMGLEVRAVGGDATQVWLELEFKAQGKLMHFNHVELEINEGDKMLVSYASLRDRRLQSGRVLVRFLANPGYLDMITLTVVVGDVTEAGYQIRVRDFVEPKKQR